MTSCHIIFCLLSNLWCFWWFWLHKMFFKCSSPPCLIDGLTPSLNSAPPRHEPLPCHASLGLGESRDATQRLECAELESTRLGGDDDHSPGGTLDWSYFLFEFPSRSLFQLSGDPPDTSWIYEDGEAVFWWDYVCPNPWPLACFWAQHKHSLPVRNHDYKLEILNSEWHETWAALKTHNAFDSRWFFRYGIPRCSKLVSC